MATVRFTLLNDELQAEVSRGATLLDAASRAGVKLNSICGGEGICGKCKVIVETGEVDVGSTSTLTREEIKNGYTLACQTQVKSDLEVRVPPESTATKGKILIDEDAQRFKALTSDGVGSSVKYEPLIEKYYLELPEPSLKDNLSDHRRIYRELRRKKNLPIMQTGLKVFKRSSSLLRDNDWKVTPTLGRRGDTTEVIQLEGGNTSDTNYGVAVDIGTTTVVAHLLDLVTSDTLDAEATYNSQMKYGEEVTRRIRHGEEDGREDLQKALANDINDLIYALVDRNGVKLKDVTSVMCSGNTAMLHFLLGLEASHIRKKPYVPNTTKPPPIRAAEVGIKVNPRGLLYFMPAIGGWVGGDVTSGVLSTGIHKTDQLTMLTDIGTNGEILIGNSDWMMSCAASAGPAFEGTGIRSGMRASRGAIDKVEFAEGDLIYSVIGDTKPEGICGSGLIDLVASLFEGGFVNRSGKLMPDHSDRIEEEEGELKFILEKPSKTGRDGELAVFQSEIKNLINAKAAIYSGARILLKSLDLDIDDLDQLLIAGGFGSYLNREKAKILGLIPDLPSEKIKFVGNTSIIGAKMALLSQQAYEESREISESVTYYDLIDYPNYFEEFTAAKFLPHTDLSQFGSVDFSEKAGGD
ncbi:ASKHA domain-containing protein [Candidatus Bipolaricaulota bacterium]|nr:ASKHA domain-containing protein [Candidatus Bipolaricaulota bacterium]